MRDIAKELRKTSYEWAVFHTRLASIGSKCDKNCHPFIREDIVLAMNGTEHSVDFLSKTIDITDTEAILETMYRYNLGLAALRNFSSIFMGFFKGKPFVVAGNTSNIKVLKKKNNKALVFASDFPPEFKSNIYTSTQKFIWNGENLPNSLKKYKKRFFPSVLFNDYGQYCFDNFE